MQNYEVFVQDQFYKSIPAQYVSDILRQVTLDIENHLVPNFDDSKPSTIKIIPIS